MQVHGQVSRYSIGKNLKNSSIYTMIQVGDDFLSDIVVPDSLQVFLKEAHSAQAPATLHITKGNMLAGITMPNGERFAFKPKLQGNGLLLLFCSIALAPILIGLILLPAAIKEVQAESFTKKLRSEGFIQV